MADALMRICEGLSPLARGNRVLGESNPLRRGPIPAGAGEPDTQKASICRKAAYPRWRGGTPNMRVLLEVV